MPTSPESIQVWVVCLANHTPDSWRPVLDRGEWDKAMRFRLPADQLRSAVTRGVLKTLLSRSLDLPAKEIAFTQNEFGKPTLAGSPIEFNVSHSGDYALLAFAERSPLGVDVEQIKDNRVVSDLARRVLSPAEYKRFSKLPDDRSKQTFFEIWTLKESVLKGIGSGLSVLPEDIEIAFHPDQPSLLSAPLNQIPDVNKWSLQSLSIGDDKYAAAIAVRSRSPSITLRHFESRSPDNT
jgi:4'-phosphopantetheinyl transferase